jgi:apolipoprotein N-acyltransferase
MLEQRVSRGRELAFGAVAVALSAAMVWFSAGNRPLWPCAWLAPVPVMLFALRTSPRKGALATAAAWALGRLSLFSYFALVRIPLPAACLFVVLPALLVAAFVQLSRALALLGALWAAALAFPSAWVALEWALSLGDDGTWGSLAYTQLDFLPVVQIASVTGLFGVSFVVCLAAAGLAIGLHARSRPLLLATACMVLVVVGYGALRLARGAHDDASIHVGQAAIAQTDEGVAQVIGGDPSRLAAILDAYGTEVRALATEGASVVVLPEEIAGVRPEDAAHAREQLGAIATASHVTLVAGVRLIDQPKGKNVALIFSPSGELRGTYVKEHLVVGLEMPHLLPGGDLLVLDAPAPMGVEICKDMDFPPLTRRYAGTAAGLLLVPAWDFDVDGWMHARMAIMRSIEQGLPLVRSAQNGVLTVSDAFGRVLRETTTGDATVRQSATVSVGHHGTFYGALGDWFVYSALAILAGAAVRLAWVWRKQARSARAARASRVAQSATV